eukprot:Hpha_TRINITY_DN24259_c0_g1::TRINITY_DN24259_c0_g1_i1::g.36014::m.36014
MSSKDWQYEDSIDDVPLPAPPEVPTNYQDSESDGESRARSRDRSSSPGVIDEAGLLRLVAQGGGHVHPAPQPSVPSLQNVPHREPTPRAQAGFDQEAAQWSSRIRHRAQGQGIKESPAPMPSSPTGGVVSNRRLAGGSGATSDFTPQNFGDLPSRLTTPAGIVSGSEVGGMVVSPERRMDTESEPSVSSGPSPRHEILDPSGEADDPPQRSAAPSPPPPVLTPMRDPGPPREQTAPESSPPPPPPTP